MLETGPRIAPGRGGLRSLVAGLSLAAALVVAGSATAAAIDRERAQTEYQTIWATIDRLGTEIVDELSAQADLSVAASEEPLFAALATALSRRGDDRHTLLVIDGTGSTLAWAGPGLLHLVEKQGIPVEGSGSRASFSAVSLFSVFPLDEAKRPHRLVVGRSFDRARFPGVGVAWGVAGEGEAVDGLAGDASVALPGKPTLLLGTRPRAGDGPDEPIRRWPWFAAPVLLLAGRLRSRRVERPGTDRLAQCLFGGAVSCAIFALGPSGWGSVAAAALGGLGLVVALRCSREPLDTRSPAIAALLVAAAVLGGFALLDRIGLPSNLFGGEPRFFASGGEELAARVTLLAAAVALFALFGKRDGGRDRAYRLPAALTLLVAAAALAGDARWGSLLAGLGAWFGAVWLIDFPFRRSFRWVASCLLLASLVAAVGWQVIGLRASERQWRETVQPRLEEAPTAALDELVARTRASFDGADVSELFTSDPVGVDRSDLAYALWRRSSLAVEGTLSALVVLADDRPVSTFSFGLPVDDEGNLDRSTERWQAVSDLVWEDALDGSEAVLHLYGHPWARVRFWVAVLPSFRGSGEWVGDLALGLLRGGPTATGESVATLPGAATVRYAEDGAVLDSPWTNSPRLDDPGVSSAETPDGPARVYAWQEPRGLTAMFVPALRPAMTLERAGVHAVGSTAIGALLLALWVGVVARRREIARLAEAVLRSYPRRLVLVFTLLLFVPLVLLNAVLLQTVTQRLENEQRRAGIAAMEAAQSILGDYVVSLEPGFVLETAVDDDLLVWLSQVVDHELNLYWGSRLSASSKRELFTAGFLPERIPGEVYSQLSNGHLPIASRPRQAGGARYLEFYAPLRLPGVGRLGANLFLSMPLLAQEEELAEETAALRRKVLLASAALFLVVLGAGGRFARNFTAPIMALVRGTERIAAGEGRLRIEPRDTELLTLSRAIDDMAERIAEAREAIQREKDLVERMVENVTAAVVSLDGEGQVQMANRVAKSLLDVRIGEPLTARWSERPDLAPLAEFAAADSHRLRRSTLRLARRRKPEAEKGPSALDGEAESAFEEWSTAWVPLSPDGELGALLVVEDVTEVLRGQRLQAWAEMARMIAHEIKNPLTPIRLSTEHLREVYAAEPERISEIFERCTSNILLQVEELRTISSEFATYSRIPKIEPADDDLLGLIREIVEGYAASEARGVRVALETDLTELPSSFDPKLIGRALRNLLENAVRASPVGETVRVGLSRTEESVTLTVTDRGPGVALDQLDRIFEPYFSTHETGTGLGLPITKRIVEEHSGTITARNRPDGGLEVRIRLPRTGAARRKNEGDEERDVGLGAAG